MLHIKVANELPKRRKLDIQFAKLEGMTYASNARPIFGL